jgi:hypothetical protein
MANIVITKTGNSIVVDMGVYGLNVGFTKASYLASDIVELNLRTNSVDVMMRDSHGNSNWSLTYDSTYGGNELFIVDSVNGTGSLSSESQLFDLITALRG